MIFRSFSYRKLWNASVLFEFFLTHFYFRKDRYIVCLFTTWPFNKKSICLNLLSLTYLSYLTCYSCIRHTWSRTTQWPGLYYLVIVYILFYLYWIFLLLIFIKSLEKHCQLPILNRFNLCSCFLSFLNVLKVVYNKA